MRLFETKLYKGPRADPRDCDYCGRRWADRPDPAAVAAQWAHEQATRRVDWNFWWIAEGQCGRCAPWVLRRRKRRKQIAAAVALGSVALGAAWWVGRHLTWRT